MLLRLSRFVHLLGVGPDRVLVIDAISHVRLVVNHEVARRIASFTKPDPVPFTASRTLSQMGIISAPALMDATRSADPQVQMWAAISLGSSDSHDPQIAAAVKPLQASANVGVRFAAQQAMQRLTAS